MLETLSQCKAAGIPVFPFGSAHLDAIHKRNLGPAVRVATRGENWYLSGNAWIARRTYPVYMQTYHGDAEGVRYVVDHGNGYFTLNTLHAGQVCPVMQDIAAH